MYIPVTFQHEWIPACAVPVAFAGNREIYQVWLYVSEHGFSSRIFIRNVYRSVTVRCKRPRNTVPDSLLVFTTASL